VIVPRALPRGGRIGICAPAGPVNPPRLHAAMDALRAAGYTVEASPSAFASHGLFSAPDEVRLCELENFFSRGDIDAVFCARGGVGSSRLLASLNARAVARSAKPFLGFSDITVLQWRLFQEGLITFSGPLAVEWDGSVNVRSQRRALDLLNGNANLDLCANVSRETWRVLQGRGKVVGRLLAGNLTMIATLLGTPFLPDMSGVLLAIEDVNEPAYRVDRLLFHLRNAGLLARIGGLLVGDLCGPGEEENDADVMQSLLDATRDYSYPVITGLPFSHGAERITLPIGARVELDADNAALTLLEAVVTSL
jgi:muramoyltetrapeptide carboxypeptidase